MKRCKMCISVASFCIIFTYFCSTQIVMKRRLPGREGIYFTKYIVEHSLSVGYFLIS